jgi:hypothetical protein
MKMNGNVLFPPMISRMRSGLAKWTSLLSNIQYKFDKRGVACDRSESSYLLTCIGSYLSKHLINIHTRPALIEPQFF